MSVCPPCRLRRRCRHRRAAPRQGRHRARRPSGVRSEPSWPGPHKRKARREAPAARAGAGIETRAPHGRREHEDAARAASAAGAATAPMQASPAGDAHGAPVASREETTPGGTAPQESTPAAAAPPAATTGLSAAGEEPPPAGSGGAVRTDTSDATAEASAQTASTPGSQQGTEQSAPALPAPAPQQGAEESAPALPAPAEGRAAGGISQRRVAEDVALGVSGKPQSGPVRAGEALPAPEAAGAPRAEEGSAAGSAAPQGAPAATAGAAAAAPAPSQAQDGPQTGVPQGQALSASRSEGQPQQRSGADERRPGARLAGGVQRPAAGHARAAGTTWQRRGAAKHRQVRQQRPRTGRSSRARRMALWHRRRPSRRPLPEP